MQGRFLTQDSYKGNAYNPNTQHLYSYTGNNPVNMTDPTGHYGEWIEGYHDGPLEEHSANPYSGISESKKSENHEIFMRLIKNGHDGNGPQAQLLFEVLYGDQTRHLSTGEQMIQFALQFTGSNDDGEGLDLIEGEMNIEYSQKSRQDGFHEKTDCSSFVRSLGMLFFNEDFREPGATKAIAGKQYDAMLAAGYGEAFGTYATPNVLDLMYYHTTGIKSSDRTATHVVIYIGNNQILHASSAFGGVGISEYNTYGNIYRTIVHDDGTKTKEFRSEVGRVTGIIN